MDQDILSQFGDRVRSLRALKQLSQEQLGALANLDRTYISGVERGQRNISLLNLVKIAVALGVPPSDLLSHRGGE